MKCTVFGTGYLGATHAVGMAQLGHEVLGVDIDPGKIAKLASGEIPFYEPELADLLRSNLAAGRLRFSTDYAAAADFADIHFLGPIEEIQDGADIGLACVSVSDLRREELDEAEVLRAEPRWPLRDVRFVVLMRLNFRGRGRGW